MKISRRGRFFARYSYSPKPGIFLGVVALLAIMVAQAVLIAPDAMAQRRRGMLGGLLTPEVVGGAPIFITNKWSNWRLAVDQDGRLYESDPNQIDVNASWRLEAVSDAPGVYKIQSSTYGRYLQIDNNDLKAGKLETDGPHAHWTFEPGQGSLRIRNVSNPDVAINNQDNNEQRGPVRVSFVGEGWWSAMWNLQALSEQEIAQRAALIIRQDNVPLTGLWRQVSSDFYPCPECRLGILASRFRRVDQEGAGGLLLSASSCMVGEGYLDNTLQGTERVYLVFKDPHPWKTAGFNTDIHVNGDWLTLRYTSPIAGTGGGQAANMPVLTETYVREIGPQDFNAANYDSLMDRMKANTQCVNVPTAAQLASVGKPPPAPPRSARKKDNTAEQVFGKLLQLGLGIVANELNKNTNQPQQPRPPQFQPPQPQQPFQQPFQTPQPQTFAQPSFNCGGQLNATEQRICSNAQIAQLDVQMASMYKQQRANLSGNQQATLKQQQSDWLRQRNACGGSDNCIFQAYQWRISQLAQGGAGQGGGNPVMGGGDVNTVTFFCEGGFQLTVRFDNRGQTPLAYLINAQGQEAQLVSAQSGTGARYVGGDIELHTKNDTAIITQAGREAICKSQ